MPRIILPRKPKDRVIRFFQFQTSSGVLTVSQDSPKVALKAEKPDSIEAKWRSNRVPLFDLSSLVDSSLVDHRDGDKEWATLSTQSTSFHYQYLKPIHWCWGNVSNAKNLPALWTANLTVYAKVRVEFRTVLPLIILIR